MGILDRFRSQTAELVSEAIEDIRTTHERVAYGQELTQGQFPLSDDDYVFTNEEFEKVWGKAPEPLDVSQDELTPEAFEAQAQGLKSVLERQELGGASVADLYGEETTHPPDHALAESLERDVDIEQQQGMDI